MMQTTCKIQFNPPLPKTKPNNKPNQNKTPNKHFCFKQVGENLNFSRVEPIKPQEGFH